MVVPCTAGEINAVSMTPVLTGVDYATRSFHVVKDVGVLRETFFDSDGLGLLGEHNHDFKDRIKFRKVEML